MTSSGVEARRLGQALHAWPTGDRALHPGRPRDAGARAGAEAPEPAILEGRDDLLDAVLHVRERVGQVTVRSDGASYAASTPVTLRS